MAELLKVFVYGTLKPGECNYSRYCEPYVVAAASAIVRGSLYALPLGYPALTQGHGWVRGVVLSFQDVSVLRSLDQLEDYSPHRPIAANEYIRRQTQTFSLAQQPLGTAWVYQMSAVQAKRLGGRLLYHGEWHGRTKA